jgi:hypothetical protein
LISRSVAVDLLNSIGAIGFGDARAACAIMAMPEAAIHKNHFAARGKNEIRISRQVFPMESEAIAEPVNETADGNLRTRVAAFDSTHNAAAFLIPHPIVLARE